MHGTNVANHAKTCNVMLEAPDEYIVILIKRLSEQAGAGFLSLYCTTNYTFVHFIACIGN